MVFVEREGARGRLKNKRREHCWGDRHEMLPVHVPKIFKKKRNKANIQLGGQGSVTHHQEGEKKKGPTG